MKNLLSKINNPTDLRKLPENQLPQLAQELREFIIDMVSRKEGHLGASLGVVELTIALHYVFNTPEDLLVWDVGHQAYGHKILTGRRDIFHTNRELNGISGFPKRDESIYDAFGVGHSSTSISAALGMALATQLKGEVDKQHIAVIGDAKWFTVDYGYAGKMMEEVFKNYKKWQELAKRQRYFVNSTFTEQVVESEYVKVLNIIKDIVNLLPKAVELKLPSLKKVELPKLQKVGE